MSPWPSTPQEKLVRLFRGYWVSQAIYVATELGIADLLADGPRTVADLAGAAGAHAPTLRRVLRLLASEGVFVEVDSDRFELTPMAAPLQRDKDELRLQVLFVGREASWRAAGDLLHAVKTGETPFDHVHGAGFFEYLREHPDEGRLFDQLMVVNTTPVGRAVAAVYDFSSMSTIVDVGGGRGALTLGILAANTRLRGVVFDQPSVTAGAREAIAAAGLSDRCEAVGGDFFQAVPEGGDAYLLKFILHDWDDERCVSILRACRRAIRADGRVLVIEFVLNARNTPSFATTQDINMLINLGGQERTEAEYGALFTTAGFELTTTVQVLGDMRILEGVAAAH
jgi:predicted O-methyltransferase YrrM